jgi:hypothetical protein
MNEDRYITEKGFESALAREDIKNKRLWILVIILLVMLFGSNAGWIWYESQFEDVVTISQDVETQSSPAYVNGTGSMSVNGESKANDN